MPDNGEERSAGAATKPAPRRQPTRPRPRRQPPYNVILIDDDDHTYDYVITMLQRLFAHPPERGYQLAREVDASGRAILLTTTLEHAELKREQIHAYGADPLLARSKGSMTAVLEPAPDDG